MTRCLRVNGPLFASFSNCGRNVLFSHHAVLLFIVNDTYKDKNSLSERLVCLSRPKLVEIQSFFRYIVNEEGDL